MGKETFKTENGDVLVIPRTLLTLEDETKVWACSSLAKRLEEDKEDKDKSFPCHVSSNGKVQNNQNKSYQYYGFDLVWSE